MSSEATVRSDASRPAIQPNDGSCPHLLLPNALGAETVARLLDYVAARENDFRPADSRRRGSRERSVDQAVRDCLSLDALGGFEEPLSRLLANIAPHAVTELHVAEAALEPSEFEICSYGDGGHFDLHTDTLPRRDHVRVLSCVYYFSTMPRRFGGGELRIYPPAGPEVAADNLRAITVNPEPDTLIVFPSSLRHEVLPVDLQSSRWIDRRFTINCWMHPARDQA
jgi:Rps23 Pro-64 3,4-dihydroxylase Tpa1-like proline 4-hydroxylase